MEEINKALKRIDGWISKFETFNGKNNLSTNSIIRL